MIISRSICRISGLFSSKTALDGMIRAVAIEAADFQIRINNVNPGYIVTPMFRRFMDPDSEAEKILIKQRQWAVSGNLKILRSW